jgi:pyrroloquinoline quinone (PQQ) biosynthesis protein C
MLYTIPALYLHLEYYFKNVGQELRIMEDEIRFRDKDQKELTWKFHDLQKIILYKSASLDRGGVQLSAIESYHYARIIPKQGSEIIVTCLMTPNVEEEVKKIRGVKFERKKRLFASLNISLRLLPDK